jgi:hypothetical protein
VKILPQSMRLGPAQNFSRTIAQCTGDIILTCDQDDHWLSDKLAIFEKLFDENSDCKLVFSDLRIMHSDNTPTPRTFWQDMHFRSDEQKAICTDAALRVLLRRNVVVGASMGFRSELATLALPVPEVFMHDEWLALIASLIGKIQTISKPLVSYRIHSKQSVGSQSGLREQWCQAHKIMTPEYFANRIVRAQTLACTANKFKDQWINCENGYLIRGLIAHANSITRMHRFWPWRLLLIPLELLTGRYYRYDYGLKGLARDILL